VSRRHHVKAKLVIRWQYDGRHTRLLSITSRDLPRDAHITTRCLGRGCPRPSRRSASASAVRGLWRALTRQVFTAGDRETFTIAAPGLLPERSELLIRKGARPIAKVL
jgi:hypothetical protein